MAEKTFITLWRGRPLTELSREELIEAVEYLGRELEVARKRNRDDIRFLMTARRGR